MEKGPILIEKEIHQVKDQWWNR